MTNPTIQKTWEFALNGLALQSTDQGSTAAHLDRRETMLGIKQMLTNTGSWTGTFTAPWTVVSSSNGSTAGASDNWNTAADLVWRDEDSTGTNFGWIVLRQTGISTTFELLIALESDTVNDDGSQIYASVAQAGFTGGTTNTAPTATDERILRDDNGLGNGHWGTGADAASTTNIRYHVMMSSDGECTRVLIFMDKIVTGFWLFDVPDNPATGWTNPYVAVVYGQNNSTTNVTQYGLWYDSANMLGRYSGTDTTVYLSGEGIANSGVGEFLKANQVDNTWIASEMGVVSQTSTFTGRMGTMYDLWWGGSFSSSEATGRLYPETGTKLYVQVKDMIFPWDGTSVLETR
jgi:hypothetical protein